MILYTKLKCNEKPSRQQPASTDSLRQTSKGQKCQVEKAKSKEELCYSASTYVYKHNIKGEVASKSIYEVSRHKDSIILESKI